MFRTKAGKVNKIVKQSDSITLLLDTEPLRDYFIKHTLRSKKEYLAYLAQDKIITEMIDLIIVKELTTTSAERCHWCSKILSTVTATQVLDFLFSCEGKYIDQLLSILSLTYKSPVQQMNNCSILEWEIPNYLVYACQTLVAIFTKKPKEALAYLDQRKEGILSTIFANFESSFLTRMLASICTTQECISAPPIWLQELLQNVEITPATADSVARLYTDLPPSLLLDTLSGRIQSRTSDVLALFLDAASASDGRDIWVTLCKWWKGNGASYQDYKHESLEKNTKTLALALTCPNSSLGATYALAIVEEAWMEVQYSLVKELIPFIVNGLFDFPHRNLFHVQATKLLGEIMTSKSISVEKFGLRDTILKTKIVQRAAKALDTGTLPVSSRVCLGKILAGFPSDATTTELRQKLDPPPLKPDSCFDLSLKLKRQKQESTRSFVLATVVDLPQTPNSYHRSVEEEPSPPVTPLNEKSMDRSNSEITDDGFEKSDKSDKLDTKNGCTVKVQSPTNSPAMVKTAPSSAKDWQQAHPVITATSSSPPSLSASPKEKRRSKETKDKDNRRK